MDKKELDLKNQFLEALHKRYKILVKFYSKEDNLAIERICAPMDYGPSRRSKDKSNRFHFWDYASDVGGHTLSLKLDQIQSIKILPSSFEPIEFVTWNPQWSTPRDWGEFS